MFGSSYSSERLFALAGIASCAALIDEFATSGSATETELDFFVSAFIDTDPSSSSRALRPNPAFAKGLQLLGSFSQAKSERDRRLLVYSLQSIQLMQQFMRRSDLVALLGDELASIAVAESLDERLLAMGSLYEKTVSTLPFRIQIQGSQGYLRQGPVAQKIRGTLFCAIRFALLWQQQGGSKFDFLLRKANIRQIASDNLSKIS
jgi:high frequency lysogenization protein